MNLGDMKTQQDYTYENILYGFNFSGRVHKITKMTVKITPDNYSNVPVVFMAQLPGDYSASSGRVIAPSKTVRATGSVTFTLKPRASHDWANIIDSDIMLSLVGASATPIEAELKWSVYVRLWYRMGNEFDGVTTQRIPTGLVDAFKQIAKDAVSNEESTKNKTYNITTVPKGNRRKVTPIVHTGDKVVPDVVPPTQCTC